MAKLEFDRILLCVYYKVIKEFKQSENNSVSSLAKKLRLPHSKVDSSINRYLKPKIKKLKKL